MKKLLIIFLLSLNVKTIALASSEFSAVERFQDFLIEKGYLNGRADGIIGPKTLKAYNKFASDHNYGQKENLTPLYLEEIITNLSKPTGVYSIDYFHTKNSCDPISFEEVQSRLAKVLNTDTWSRLSTELFCDHQFLTKENRLVFTTRKGDRYDSIFSYGQEKAEDFNKERRRVELKYNEPIKPADKIVFEFETKIVDNGDYLRSGFQYPIWYLAQIKEANDIHYDGQTPIVLMISVDPYLGIVSNGVILQPKKDQGKWVKIKLEAKLNKKDGYERLYVNDELISKRTPNIHKFIKKATYDLKFGQYWTGIRSTSTAETIAEFRNINISVN